MSYAYGERSEPSTEVLRMFHKWFIAIAICLSCSFPLWAQLLSPSLQARYLEYIPQGVFTKDERGRLVLYDKSSFPFAYQHDGGFHSVYYNISATKPTEPFGNANREFPWVTGGLDQCPTGSTFKGLILPNGQAITGYSYNGLLIGQYPLRTKLAEFLIMNDNRGYGHCFEVRILEKIRNGDPFDVANNWKPSWFRPISSADELKLLTIEHPYRDRLWKHYQQGFSTANLKDQHTFPVLNVTTIVDELPDLPDELLSRLLNKPFKEVTDQVWVESTNGNQAYAASGGVFPRGYQGGHFASKNCLQCHQTVLKHVNNFVPGRDWYGNLRGSDGIFSIQLCDPACVSHNGFSQQPIWSDLLTRAGLLRIVR